MTTLDTMGIEPIGAESTDERLTEHREVDASGLASGFDESVVDGPETTESPSRSAVNDGPEPLPSAGDDDELPPTDEDPVNHSTGAGRSLGTNGIDPEETATSGAADAFESGVRLDLEGDDSDTTDGDERSLTGTGQEEEVAADTLDAIDPDRFYDKTDLRYRECLGRRVGDMVDQAGPIRADDLVLRIARLHGFQRTGSTIRTRTLKALGTSRQETRDPDGTVVFWPKTVRDSAVVEFRGLTVAGVKRDWTDLPWCELVGLAAQW